MPFIKSKVSCAISQDQEIELKTRLGKAISLVPGKSEAYLLLEFEDKSRLWLRGEQDAPIAYIEAAIFGNEDHLGYDAFTAVSTKAFHEVLGIPSDRIYITSLPGASAGGTLTAECLGEAMNDKRYLTVFSDPMMGLSYESEPILERLQTEYAGKLELRYVMSVLVRDVSDFMTPAERAMEPETGIRRYCERLAGIYKSEEAIGGLPIHMEGFRLFDAAHRSSKPLCLAYKAAQLSAPDRADAFLTALRHATVLDCRPTTHEDEILKIVRQTGIEEAAFLRCFHNGDAEAALQEDLQYTARLGIRSLPAYLIQYQERRVLFQSFDYRDFSALIEKIQK